MRRATVVAVLALIGAAAWPGPLRLVSSQTPGQTSRDATTGPPQGTSAIGGTLVAADTGRPVRYARVTRDGRRHAHRAHDIHRRAGPFTVPGLNAGLYTLTASKGGMLDVIFGQKRPGSGRPGTPIQLNANQKLETISLKMARGGVIAGTVIDELGEPMFGDQRPRVAVRAAERRAHAVAVGQRHHRRSRDVSDRRAPAGRVHGHRGAVGVSGDAHRRSRRDEDAGRGDARAMEAAAAARASAPPASGDRAAQMAGAEKFLMEQQKEVADRIAMMNATGEPTEAYVPSFYPGSSNSNAATSVTLDISEERGGVDMQVLRQPIGRISGTLSISDGVLPPSAHCSSSRRIRRIRI